MKETKTKDALRFGGFGGGHAIVIGASTTGLAASAAAARHFQKVTNLERDELPDEPVWRKGVPQSRHGHILLKGGQNVFNHYFPGMTAEMLANGSVEVDLGNDICWHHSGGWKTRFHSGFTMQCQTKGYLEWYVRQRLLKWPNVQFRPNSKVESLIERKGRIVGVRLAGGVELEADLVIDASGRSSTTVQNLHQLGFGSPEITELPVDIGYSTQIFKPGPSTRDWKGMLIHSRPPATRTAALLPIEGGRWILTQIGWMGDHPGGDYESFMEFARGMPVPDLYNAIRNAEAIGPVYRWRFPSNLRRHFDRMATMPDGLVVVGDANTSLNPIYAQGMSHGAIGASILDASLEEQRQLFGQGNLSGLTARFQRGYSKFLDECWFTSTAEDYGAVKTGKRRPWFGHLATRYLQRLTELTWHDQTAARAFIDVMHLQRPPTSLMRPELAWKALLGAPSHGAATAIPARG